MDDLSLLDDLLVEGSEITIIREHGEIIILRDGITLAIEDTLRAAVREAFSKAIES